MEETATLYRVAYKYKVEPGEHGITYKPPGDGNFVDGVEMYYEDIEDLGDLLYFNGIETVVPVQVKFFDPVPQAEIDDAIANKKEEVQQERRMRRIREAERELTEAKAALPGDIHGVRGKSENIRVDC